MKKGVSSNSKMVDTPFLYLYVNTGWNLNQYCTAAMYSGRKQWNIFCSQKIVSNIILNIRFGDMVYRLLPLDVTALQRVL